MPQPALVSDLQLISSLKGIYAQWPELCAALGNCFFFVITATILAYLLFAICLLIKYLPQLYNDCENFSAGEFPELGIKLWMVFVLALPLFLNAGPIWFILWWALIFWGYINRPEKRILVVFLFLFLMSGLIAHIGGGLISYTKTQVNKEIYFIDRGMDTPEDLNQLRAWISKHSADTEPMNALALTMIRKNDYDSAVTLLTHALDIEQNPRYYNHLGIALAGLKKYNESAKAFENASILNSKNIVYYYNISKVFLANYRIAEAEQAIKRANMIDPNGINALLSGESKTNRIRFVTENVKSNRQLARQMKPSDSLSTAADALWYMAIGLTPRNASIAVGFAVLILFVLAGYIPDDKYTKLCIRCGNSFYVGTKSNHGHPVCLQCNWLESKAKKTPGLLANKIEDVKRFRNRTKVQTAKMEIILPGLGSLIANKTARAVILLFLMSFGLTMIITGGSFMYSFIPSENNLHYYIRGLGAFIVAVLYIAAFRQRSEKLGA